MSHPFQATLTDLDALEYEFYKGTKIYTRKKFEGEITARAKRKMQRILDAIAPKATADDDDNEKYTIPPGLTVEQHLFALTFCDKERPIKFIENAFRQYEPEYGYWRLILDEELEQKVLEYSELAHYPPNKDGVARSLATAANVDKALKFATKKLWCLPRSSNKHLIAFRNVTVCTKTGSVSPHNPDNYITTCLPYDYTPGASCPEAMMRYIISSFGADQIEYVRAALGLVLDLTTKDKFIHLIGASGSGKGVFTRLIMKFFGAETVGSIDNFKVFAQPETVHQHIAGKRLIVLDDIVNYVGEEVGRFYTAVERTAMNARGLFKPKGYTQSFDCRYTVASTSHLASKHSNSKGWKRRVFPLPTVRWADQDEDANLGLELENCIADIVSWALAQDKEIRNNIIEHPERYNLAAAEYFRESAASSSSAWAFIDECLVPVEPTANDSIEDQSISDQQLSIAYKAYCVAKGRQPSGLDSLKHQIRESLPVSWVDRQKGGKVKARFVYMRLRPGIFDFGDIGATCNLNNLGYDGVSLFKDWAKTYGCLHPYSPQDLQRLNESAPEPKPAPEPPAPASNSDPEPAPPTPTSPTEPLPPDHGCRDKSGNVTMAWITPGKDDWWQSFENALIQATTLTQMQEAKAKLSALKRITVMGQWQADGRYPWLEAKAERLKAEADSVAQLQLGG